MKYVKRLASSFAFLVSLSGCQTMQIEDFKAGVTLPYSGNCYFVNAVSGKVTEYPEDQCLRMKKAALIILSDDWKIIRKDFQRNCQVLQCKQLVGQFDQLFLTIDKGLQLVPWQ